MRYQPAHHVRWVEHSEYTILLCLNSGAFLGLNGTAKIVWGSLITGSSVLETAQHLSSEYNVDLQRALVEVQIFLESCKEKSLIASMNSSTEDRIPTGKDRSPSVKPSILRAAIIIFITRAKLRFSGFARAYWDTEFISEKHETKNDADINSIKNSLDVFLTAEGLLPYNRSHHDCLSRSLSLYRFLRTTGAPVRHHIGIREHPFESHSWVTFQSDPLLNDPRQLLNYKTIAELPSQFS